MGASDDPRAMRESGAGEPVAVLLVDRAADGRWSAKAQARGVIRYVALGTDLVTVLDVAAAFIAGELSRRNR